MTDIKTTAELEQVISNLKSVLCDPVGNCCIQGSHEDRLVVDEALTALTAYKERLDSKEFVKELADSANNDIIVEPYGICSDLHVEHILKVIKQGI